MLVYSYSSLCDAAPTTSRSFCVYRVDWNAFLTRWPHALIEAFACVAGLPSQHLFLPFIGVSIFIAVQCRAGCVPQFRIHLGLLECALTW